MKLYGFTFGCLFYRKIVRYQPNTFHDLTNSTCGLALREIRIAECTATGDGEMPCIIFNSSDQTGVTADKVALERVSLPYCSMTPPQKV
jgi:hypothetical protein